MLAGFDAGCFAPNHDAAIQPALPETRWRPGKRVQRLIARHEREKEATGPAGRGAGREGPISAEGGPQTGRVLRLVM